MIPWWFTMEAVYRRNRGSLYLVLVGGFNPFEKYESNWIISPGRGENKKKNETTTQLSWSRKRLISPTRWKQPWKIKNYKPSLASNNFTEARFNPKDLTTSHSIQHLWSLTNGWLENQPLEKEIAAFKKIIFRFHSLNFGGVFATKKWQTPLHPAPPPARLLFPILRQQLTGQLLKHWDLHKKFIPRSLHKQRPKKLAKQITHTDDCFIKPRLSKLSKFSPQSFAHLIQPLQKTAFRSKSWSFFFTDWQIAAKQTVGSCQNDVSPSEWMESV